jgi:hypothetical protein
MTFSEILAKHTPEIAGEFFVEVGPSLRFVFRQVRSREDRETVYSAAREATMAVQKGLDPLGGFEKASPESVFRAMVAHAIYARTEAGDEVHTENSQRAWLEFATGPQWKVFDNLAEAIERVIAGSVQYGMVQAVKEAEKN